MTFRRRSGVYDRTRSPLGPWIRFEGFLVLSPLYFGVVSFVVLNGNDFLVGDAWMLCSADVFFGYTFHYYYNLNLNSIVLLFRK